MRRQNHPLTQVAALPIDHPILGLSSYDPDVIDRLIEFYNQFGVPEPHSRFSLLLKGLVPAYPLGQIFQDLLAYTHESGETFKNTALDLATRMETSLQSFAAHQRKEKLGKVRDRMSRRKKTREHRLRAPRGSSVSIQLSDLSNLHNMAHLKLLIGLERINEERRENPAHFSEKRASIC